MNNRAHYQPFVYCWFEKTTRKYYIGSRTAKNCHPQDGYICSSKVVKEKVLLNPENWIRQVLKTFSSRDDAREYEVYVLKLLRVVEDKMSYNQSYGSKDFTFKEHSLSSKAKISKSNKGRRLSKEAWEKLKMIPREKRSMFGKKHSEETKAKQSLAKKNRFLGEESSRFKGSIMAFDLQNKKEIKFNGRRELENAGFDAGCVSKVVNGKLRVHKGHIFYYGDLNEALERFSSIKSRREKLSKLDIKDIRLRYSNGESQNALAKYYKVDQASISNIVNLKSWKNI